MQHGARFNVNGARNRVELIACPRSIERDPADSAFPYEIDPGRREIAVTVVVIVDDPLEQLDVPFGLELHEPASGRLPNPFVFGRLRELRPQRTGCFTLAALSEHARRQRLQPGWRTGLLCAFEEPLRGRFRIALPPILDETGVVVVLPLGR